MAYFTRLSVVPLDGLMADRQFQTELAQRGIGDFIRKDRIDAFAGPTVPFDTWGKETYCGKLFLESTRYTCEPWAKGSSGEPQWMITGVEVYSAAAPGAGGLHSAAAVQHRVDGEKLCDDLENIRQRCRSRAGNAAH